MKKKDIRSRMEHENIDDYVRRQAAQMADDYERSLSADASLDHIRLTPEMREDMMRRIAALDAGEIQVDLDAALGLKDEMGDVPLAAGFEARPAAADARAEAAQAAGTDGLPGVTAPKNASAVTREGTATAHAASAMAVSGEGTAAVQAASVSTVSREDAATVQAASTDGLPGATTPEDASAVSGEGTAAAHVASATAASGDGASAAADADAARRALAQLSDEELLRLLSEKDREALELGRKKMNARKRRKKLRLAGVAAAAAVLVVGASVSIGAGRIKISNLWDFFVGKEAVFQLENELQPEEQDATIQEVCADILERTGIRPLEFMYMPENMLLKDYVIDEECKTAYLSYSYQNTILRVAMIKKRENAVWGRMFDGEIRESFPIESNFGTVTVMEVTEPKGETGYAAELLYDDCQYTVFGIVSQEEFTKLMENINLF